MTMRTQRRPLETDRRRRRLRRRFHDLRSVPVLPSMVTLGNVFFGFLAMAKAADAVILQGSHAVLQSPVLALFETAALLVFLAMVFDALDGAVARLTNQTSAFGAQLDSLADVVTFGVAPAFIAKLLVDFHARPEPGPALLPAHAKLYWAAAAIYVLCAAMRLARYNVEAGADEGGRPEPKEFVGLPSPAAAAVICSFIAFFATRNDSRAISRLVLGPELSAELYHRLIVSLPAALVVIGLLMVSRFPYPHLVATLVRGRHSFPFLATMVVLVFAAAIEWQFALIFLSLLYVASGVLLGLLRLLMRGRMGPPRAAGADPGLLDEDADEAGDGGADGGAGVGPKALGSGRLRCAVGVGAC